MDWAAAIERNRLALVAIVAAIAALLGGRDEAGPVVRTLRNAALALLRPAEAAARRLIVIAARGLAVARGAPFLGNHVFQRGPVLRQAEGGSERVPAFPLFDRWKRFGPLLLPAKPAGIPRIRTFWNGPLIAAALPQAATPPVARAMDPDALVDAARLRLRLQSLGTALADLPRQARRLARWRGRAAARPGVVARSPMRPGRPPGHRRRPDRDVDQVLRDCHALACAALRPDTS